MQIWYVCNVYVCISHFDFSLCPTTVARYLCHYTGSFKFKTSQRDLSITFLIIDQGNLEISSLLIYHHHHHHRWLTLDGKPPAIHAKPYFNQCTISFYSIICCNTYDVYALSSYTVHWFSIYSYIKLFKLFSIICIACIHWKSCIVKHLIAYCRQAIIESQIWCLHTRSSICTWTNRETATNQPLACW